MILNALPYGWNEAHDSEDGAEDCAERGVDVADDDRGG